MARDYAHQVIDHALAYVDGKIHRQQSRKLLEPIKSAVSTELYVRVEPFHLFLYLEEQAMQGDRERCLAAGMDSYISKPIRPRELIELLEKFCDVAQEEGVNPTVMLPAAE